MSNTPIAAVVIMYHPEDWYVDNIYTYLDQVDKLYIIDNSEVHKERCFSKIRLEQKVVIIANEINHGIAAALNMGCSEAHKDGFDWLLTMDQDSYFDKAVLNNYLREVDKCDNKELVAVFGLPYDKDFLTDVTPAQILVDVQSLITSGSLVNLVIWENLQGFNEKLFIDEVDHEYCYRAKLAGFRVICVRAGLMTHSLGKTLMTTTVSGGIKKKTLHAPLRIYYIVRNGLYIYSHYRKVFPKPAKKRLKLIYVTLKNNLLYGDHRLSVFKYALLGTWHAITRRYYKL